MPPAPISAATLTDALRWRYATQKFSDRKIPAETWTALEQSLVLAPSSAGLQPWKFVVVQDPETRKRLAAAAHKQTKPVECSHFVVFAVRKNLGGPDIDRFFDRVAEVRQVPLEDMKGHRDMITGAVDRARTAGHLDTWMSRQVYIALGQFMTSAALLGVDTCAMEGIEPAKFDEILGLDALGYASCCACAAGYRSAEDQRAGLPKVRFRTEDVILHI
jgi:nitroreductase